MNVINAYNRFALPKYWGSGKRASADGTKCSLYDQNLLSEYHVRYGGYGGIGYYHVPDMYIALFGHFIPCGVHEAVDSGQWLRARFSAVDSSWPTPPDT